MENFDLSTVNFLAVLVATIVYFFLGAIWYSPLLFGTVWAKIQKFDMTDQSRKKGLGKLLIFSFINTFITASIMSLYAGGMGADSLVEGLCLGASSALGYMVTSITTTFLYESKPTKLYFIDIGYHFAGFLIAGAIIGAWR